MMTGRATGWNAGGFGRIGTTVEPAVDGGTGVAERGGVGFGATMVPACGARCVPARRRGLCSDHGLLSQDHRAGATDTSRDQESALSGKGRIH
jgi:hypothetical protein